MHAHLATTTYCFLLFKFLQKGGMGITFLESVCLHSMAGHIHIWQASLLFASKNVKLLVFISRKLNSIHKYRYLHSLSTLLHKSTSLVVLPGPSHKLSLLAVQKSREGLKVQSHEWVMSETERVNWTWHTEAKYKSKGDRATYHKYLASGATVLQTKCWAQNTTSSF